MKPADPIDVRLGSGAKVFLVCGDELVERDRSRLRTTRIKAPGPASLLSASSTTDEVIARSSDGTTLYWWHGNELEQLSDGSSWRCADALSRTAISIHGAHPNGAVHVVDLASGIRRVLPLSRSTVDALESLVEGCAISGDRVAFAGKKSPEFWHGGGTRPDEIVGWLPKSEGISVLRLLGRSVGWIEYHEERTMRRYRPRARLLDDGAPSRTIGASVGPLNALTVETRYSRSSSTRLAAHTPRGVSRRRLDWPLESGSRSSRVTDRRIATFIAFKRLLTVKPLCLNLPPSGRRGGEVSRSVYSFSRGSQARVEMPGCRRNAELLSVARSVTWVPGIPKYSELRRCRREQSRRIGLCRPTKARTRADLG